MQKLQPPPKLYSQLNLLKKPAKTERMTAGDSSSHSLFVYHGANLNRCQPTYPKKSGHNPGCLAILGGYSPSIYSSIFSFLHTSFSLLDGHKSFICTFIMPSSSRSTSSSGSIHSCSIDSFHQPLSMCPYHLMTGILTFSLNLYFKSQPVLMSFLILSRIVILLISLRLLVSKNSSSVLMQHLSPVSHYHTIHSKLLFHHTYPFLPLS